MAFLRLSHQPGWRIYSKISRMFLDRAVVDDDDDDHHHQSRRRRGEVVVVVILE